MPVFVVCFWFWVFFVFFFCLFFLIVGGKEKLQRKAVFNVKETKHYGIQLKMKEVVSGQFSLK